MCRKALVVLLKSALAGLERTFRVAVNALTEKYGRKTVN
jgi:hypothetical protein